ncbi:phosphoenolpyruvate carboxykinase (ATP) [Anseongella ginsenosidimutans]|uniref:phosphoenolpyruvate carboxykinase (ATP) n=1 Tax=Anseongella ginsenosidimutans TaxID=496056 RepID=UPI001CEF9376|nr:phosphoenolpyruvate carboxykinase (ATP) [Anseongella ginsenosidimutans]
MNEIGLKAATASVADMGLRVASARWNLSPAQMVEEAILRSEGHLASSGALAVDTGEFTGRAPKDRFIVRDRLTEDEIWWGDVNIPISPEDFDRLYKKAAAWLNNKEVFVKDAYACAGKDFRLNIRVVTEMAYQSLFAHNLFLRLQEDELLRHQPDWTILVATGFRADPSIDGTRSPNFTIINFTRRIILIGGTGYTGEIKKGIFSVLNFLLPLGHDILPMHCAANMGEKGDTAIFFGLSGTGKTTLSADPSRCLIGDDEHGWSGKGIFNFEGGCYAKCINLSKEKEPQIYRAIRFGALLENTCFREDSRIVDFSDTRKTENTRTAYPIEYIEEAVKSSCGSHPRNIFFLTADAFGVLPPISRLTAGQAMYHFISGYTAKIAGTETGINEPQATFSACFGKAFLPLHPGRYAALLGDRLRKHRVTAWLVNTGWTGGPYGTGTRIPLEYTRAMVSAALSSQLDNAPFINDPVFGLATPASCPGVPSALLTPVTPGKTKMSLI